MEEKLDGTYTEVQFERSFRTALAAAISRSYIKPKTKPCAYLLGGQSGAGKTTLHNVIKDQLAKDVVIINGDEYRSLHPQYRELDAQYGPECVKYTAPWAGKMTEALIDTLSKMHYNLVIEGTLRTKEVPMKTATLLRERGYTVSLACMAVKPEISLISCQLRYEQMKQMGTVPRATDPEHHNAIIRDIVDNIDALEESGPFESVQLYDRAGTQRYPTPSRGEEPPTDTSASKALSDILFGAWTPEERSHYDYLKKVLAETKKGAPPRKRR